MTSKRPGDRTAPRVRSVDTAPRYEWGVGCEGWRLVADDDLSVIEEQMSAGTSEIWHVHAVAKQVFYILEGSVDLRTGDGVVRLRRGESAVIPPSIPHCVVNTAHESARFLVISSPPTRSDRHAVEPPRRWRPPEIP